MHRLFLLRHAKAAWAAPATSDFDRPLTPEGMRAARSAGAAMAESGLVPAKVLCSPALRTRQTWEGVAHALGGSIPVDFVPSLYEGGAKAYLEALREAGPAASVLMVGHNPMTEDFGEALTKDGDGDAMKAMKSGFPVCAMATIRFEQPFPAVRRGTGWLESFAVHEG